MKTTTTNPDTIAKVAKLISGDTDMTTIHNVLVQAQTLANESKATDAEPILVQSQSGYNAGGFRKPLMQIVASALGVIPVLVWQETNPANPKQVGQQPAFFGTPDRAHIASAVYADLFTWTNVRGNRALREARAKGKEAGKTGKAGDRLQENVYNELAAQVLSALGSVTASKIPSKIKTAFTALKAVPAKGGIVFSGAYNTELYDGKLLMVK